MLKKLTVVFTVFSFVISVVFSDAVYSAVVNMPGGNINASFLIPSSLGKITSAKYFGTKDIIINIQDLHCHAETQKKIASILDYIDNNYGLDKVYLEGAINNVDTSWLAAFNDGKAGTKVLENLINSGKLSGTEYYSIIKNKKNFVAGIENEQLYKENIRLLGNIINLYPEIETVCNDLEKEIKKAKKDYSNTGTKKLQQLVSSYKNKEISVKVFYKELTNLAKDLKVSTEKYNNISLYISLINKTDAINNEKLLSEFAKFNEELKNKINYKDYSALLKKSSNFNSFEDVSAELINFNEDFAVTKNLKLKNLENFFAYLELNEKINPIALVKEEELFIDELYTKLGMTRYEKEVNFLSEFIPVIKRYFKADISADEYYNFERDYNKFRRIWTEYFKDNAVKSLDKYQKLLAKYHENNIKRDNVFAGFLVPQDNILKNYEDIETADINLALKKIKPNISGKNIKLVVTGGFHTRGLEKIFENSRISYIIITPTINQDTEKSKQLYTENIAYYSKILRNTINLEPLSQEPLNISFPKILGGIFSVIQSSDFKRSFGQPTKTEIKNFIQEHTANTPLYGNVEILNYDILSRNIFDGKIEFFVEYKDNDNNGAVSRTEYVYSAGQVTDKDFELRKTSQIPQEQNFNKDKPLTVLRNFVFSSNKVFQTLYKVLIAPVVEEVVFRAAPFLLTGLIVSNPLSIIPAAVTAFIGIFGFSFAHTVADKITKQLDVRNWRHFLLPSAVLTGAYIAAALIFPQAAFAAPVFTILLHSANNIAASVFKDKKFSLLDIVIKPQNSEIPRQQKLVENLINYLSLSDVDFGQFDDKIKEVVNVLTHLEEDPAQRDRIISEQINVLFVIYKNSSKKDKYKRSLLRNLVPFSIFVKDGSNDKLLFDSILETIVEENSLADENIENKQDNIKWNTLSAGVDFAKAVYAVSEEHFAKAVSFFTEKGFLSNKQELHTLVKREIDKQDYSVLKTFYFALANGEPADDILSGLINVMCKNLYSIVEKYDFENKQRIKDILNEIYSLKENINYADVPLLDYQLAILLEELQTAAKDNYVLGYRLLNEIIFVCRRMVEMHRPLNSKVINGINMLTNNSGIYENFSNDDLNNILYVLADIAKMSSAYGYFGEVNNFNRDIADIVVSAAFKIYSLLYIYYPEQEDKENPGYEVIENKALGLFKKITAGNLRNGSIFEALFNSETNYSSRSKKETVIGLYKKSLEVFLEAARASKEKLYFTFPDDDSIFGDVDELGYMLAREHKYIDLAKMVTDFYSPSSYATSFGFARRVERNLKVREIIRRIISDLFDIANNTQYDIEERKDAVLQLVYIAAEGIYKSKMENIPVDIYEIRRLARQLNLPVYLQQGKVEIRYEDEPEYDFTSLLNFVPQNVMEENVPVVIGRYSRETYIDLVSENPVFTQISGKTDYSKPEVRRLLLRFHTLQEILEYNVSVLKMLDNLKDNSNYDKNLSEIISILQKMIDCLSKINSAHGEDAQTALNNIIAGLKDETGPRTAVIRKHFILKDWKTNSIKDIKEIHTLINALHQTSISDFKHEIGDIREIGSDIIQTINARQESSITAYNLSETVNSNIVKFMTRLASRIFSQPSSDEVRSSGEINDFICKDDMVVWTTRLNAHSVDIFFNFGNIDRGISIYYRERPVDYSKAEDEGFGKKERVRYFSTVLESLGFNVDSDTRIINSQVSYGLHAVLNKDYGLNDSTDIIDIASKVVELFKFSTNLDYDLKSLYGRKENYEEVFAKLLEKCYRGEMWYGVDINNNGWHAYGYGRDGVRLTAIPTKRKLDIAALNGILSYLGITDLIPDTVNEEDLKNQNLLDKYFNKPIEDAYVEGRIIFNENGQLEKNEGYDVLSSAIESIVYDFTESSKQCRILNLINGYEFENKIAGYAGSFVVVTKVMELVNGDKLFVKGIMSPQTRRLKYAITELVSDKKRQKITSGELIKILAAQGYDIKEQEWVEERESIRTYSLLKRNIRSMESPEILCSPTSEGKGTCVYGNITFDKEKIDENSILVVPYTTPDDVMFIEKAKGIITTGGGELSHAAITTREMQKPSVVFSNAVWLNNELKVQCYFADDDIKVYDALQIQRVNARDLILKESSRVLLNGDTGTVLLFDDMDIKLLDELQSYINSGNKYAVINFFKRHQNDKDINRYVEYVYFQVIDNADTFEILNELFDSNVPEPVKNKVKKLNTNYIQGKVQSLEDALSNIKSIDNINIAYTLMQQLNKKIMFIRTIELVVEFEHIKYEISKLEKEIKVKLRIFVRKLIDETVRLLGKNVFDSDDIHKAIRITNMVSVYNYFISDNETDKVLLESERLIRILIPMLEDKLNDNLEKSGRSFSDEEIQGGESEKKKFDLNREIRSFEDMDIQDSFKFGTKATELAYMYKILRGKKNVVVPKGVGISVNVLEMFLESLGKGYLIENFETAIKNKDKQTAMMYASEILILTGLSDRTDMSEEIRYAVSSLIDFGDVRFSVRSSGVGEDGTTNAFAGMGETVLNVKRNEIFKSIKDCWNSFFSERCIDYMIATGHCVRPAVLVQEMVSADSAGVVFSRDKYGNAVINAVYGLGEGLVSGMLTPDNIQVDINSGEIIEYKVADKSFKVITLDDGGTEIVPVAKNAKSRVLSKKTVADITEIIKILEDDAGYPIDVEFAVRGKNIFILQRRPITTFDKKLKVRDDIEFPEETSETKMRSFIKYRVSVSCGDIEPDMKELVRLSNPFEPFESVPVYIKSVNTEFTELVVDKKYQKLLDTGILEITLIARINMDNVVLTRLNGKLFSFEKGEIGLIRNIEQIDTSSFNERIKTDTEKIMSLLAAA